MWSNLLCSSGCVLRTSISLPLFLLDAYFLFSRTVNEKSQNRFSVKTVYLVHPNEWRKKGPILELLILSHGKHCKKPTFSKKSLFLTCLHTIYIIYYHLLIQGGFKVILHTYIRWGRCKVHIRKLTWRMKAEGFIYTCTSCLYIVLLYTTSYNAIRISTNARIEEKTVW